ncbi:MAG: hypothetical protein O3C43_04090 [Verrucomicrobia bacterium]|nr:hypothetical protein [Verrucomicrobiota bacterium]MDA1065663.1 hypothetical protein [Verrucomicrobiota bacterium]
MKKLLGIIAVLVIIVGIGMFVLAKSAGKIIQTAVVRLGPEIAQVDIELKKVNISFLSGAGGLEGLKIHNPEGFSGEHAFYAEHLALDLKPMSVLSDKIVIEEILIIGPDIQFEQKLGSSNLKQILDNVQAFAGSPEEAEEEASGGKKLEIKRFILKDAKVGVGLGTKPISITIPTIEINGLGEGEEGITGAEVISVLLTEVTSQVIAAIAKNPDVILKGGGDLLKNVGESGGNALEKLGGLFGGSKDKKEDK